jgi:hypothetical protein
MRLGTMRICAIGLCAIGSVAGAQEHQPENGAQVLRAMQDAYKGQWYSTLTFVQTTTLHRASGTVNQTWYESLMQDNGVTWLRIDQGDPSAGNGTLYTADSTWSMRGGKLTTTRGSGNEFLPLIEGAYFQPVDQTAREIARTGVDMEKTRNGQWQDRPVWIVGATSASDTTSPQFWVDTARKVVVRFVLAPSSRSILDVHLQGYEPAGRGWLATEVLMHQNGRLVQEEHYADWKTDIPLAKSLFDVSQWTTAPHWAKRIR